jgi:hypothetical protein
MRKLFVLAGAVVVALALGASPAFAGGWVVPAFDPVPPIVAGQPTAIGLRILQHGVHPLDDLEDVTLTFAADDGSTHRFTARPDGDAGHYVAQVTLAPGTYDWSLQPGFFPEHELGAVTVGSGFGAAAIEAARVDGGADGGMSTTRAVARVALPALALAAAAVAIVRPRRRVSLASS